MMAGEVARLLGLNGEQARAAADCERDVLVSAGAGTGKTRVLTARYLTLLLEYGLRPAQVAAITFTNKAAGEMRERIRQALDRLSGAFPAASVLAAELSWAPIQTIHSFCAQLLRTDPAAAGVPPGFALLEEGEADLLLAEACDQALTGALEGEGETPGLMEGLLAFGRRGFRTLMGEAVRSFRRWGLSPSRGRGEEGAGELLRRAKEDLLSWLADLPAPERGATGEALAELLAIRDEVRAAVEEGGEDAILEEAAALAGRLRTRELKDMAAAGKEAFRAFARAAAGVKAAAILPALLALAEEANRLFTAAKRRRGMLDFADLEIGARDLLAREEHARAARERFRALLVDELQDTNPLQWSVIDALRRGENGCRLFAVGDVKQSIYRFRGADVRVMENLRRELEAGRGAVYSLQENYRAAPALAALVNHVCGPLLDGDTPYEPLRPTRAPAPAETQVEAILVPGDGPDRAAEAALIAGRLAAMLDGGEEIADPADGRMRPLRPGDAALLFRAATDLRVYEKALRDKGLPYHVLAGAGFYGREEVADLLNLLRAVEDPDDGVALAAVLRSPLFAVSDAGLYRTAREAGLVRGFAAECWSSGTAWGEDGPRLARAAGVLRELRARRHLLGLDGLLARAVEATDYWALQAAYPDYRQRLANLDKLFETARHYTGLGRGELGEFLDYLAALEGLAVREGEVPLAGADDAVLLLTVHRAKGLEFPVVFLPDLGRALASHSPTLLVAEDGRAGLRFGSRQEGKASPVWCELDDREDEEGVAEAKRLLYVALTRARDRLILVGSGSGRGRSWLGWLQETIPLPSAGGTAAYPGGTVRVVRPEEFLSAPPEPAGPGTRFDLPVRTEAAAAREARPAPPRRAPEAGVALTVSGALLLRACPRRFHLRHVLGLPERSPGGGGSAGGGSALGTLVHALAAAGAGEAETAAALETARRDLPPGADRDLERLVAHYRRAESCRALAEAVHVWAEYEFQLALEGGRLAGACDLVWLDAEGAAHLADLKTNRVAVPGGELLAEHSFQVRLYGLALRRLFARLDRRARLEYLWPGVGVDVPLGEEHLAQTEAELVSLLRQAAAGRSYGEFPPRPGPSCRRCGYREGICDAAGSADDPS